MTTKTPSPFTLPLRHEIKSEDTWDLTPLFSSEEAWEASFQELSTGYHELIKFRGHLGNSAQDLLNALECEKK